MSLLTKLIVVALVVGVVVAVVWWVVTNVPWPFIAAFFVAVTMFFVFRKLVRVLGPQV